MEFFLIVLTILNKIWYKHIFINDHFKYITSELAKFTKHNIYL
jgi:isoprenylcysteine carboxyl methyltransferase (ICMT) family protein YpbQ